MFDITGLVLVKLVPWTLATSAKLVSKGLEILSIFSSGVGCLVQTDSAAGGAVF